MTRTKTGEKRARAAVQRAMGERGYTAAALAREANVDPGTVGDFLNGKRWPRREKMAAMERALLLTPGTLTQLSEGGAGEGESIAPLRRGRPTPDEAEGIAEDASYRFHPGLRRFTDAELIRELRARMLFYAARLTFRGDPVLIWALSEEGGDEATSRPAGE